MNVRVILCIISIIYLWLMISLKSITKFLFWKSWCHIETTYKEAKDITHNSRKQILSSISNQRFEGLVSSLYITDSLHSRTGKRVRASRQSKVHCLCVNAVPRCVNEWVEETDHIHPPRLRHGTNCAAPERTEGDVDGSGHREVFMNARGGTM